MGKKIEWWKELEMKIKIIVSVFGLFSMLGVGTSVNAGMEILQKISTHEDKIVILADEMIKTNYKFDRKTLQDDIAKDKKELREIRRQCGGSELPDCGEDERSDYEDATEDLEKDRKKLQSLEEKMEALKVERLNKLKEGE